MILFINWNQENVMCDKKGQKYISLSFIKPFVHIHKLFKNENKRLFVYCFIVKMIKILSMVLKDTILNLTHLRNDIQKEYLSQCFYEW